MGLGFGKTTEPHPNTCLEGTRLKRQGEGTFQTESKLDFIHLRHFKLTLNRA